MTRRRLVGQSWGLGRIAFLIGFTVLFTGLGIWQVRRQYAVISRGYAVDAELFEVRRELETKKRLSLLLSAHRNPATLRTVALEELGMKLPDRDTELHVPTSTRAASPVDPAPPVETLTAPEAP